MNNTKDRIRVLRAVALHADQYQAPAEAMGRKAAAGLTRAKRAQITGLEAMANSALKVTDVLDYVKLRTARQKEWRAENWGGDLLRYLDKDLRKDRGIICTQLGLQENGIDGLETHLMLIREFVRQVSAQYEFACLGLADAGDDAGAGEDEDGDA